MPATASEAGEKRRSGLVRAWQNCVSLGEDIVILGKFAFGREYVRLPVS